MTIWARSYWRVVGASHVLVDDCETGEPVAQHRNVYAQNLGDLVRRDPPPDFALRIKLTKRAKASDPKHRSVAELVASKPCSTESFDSMYRDTIRALSGSQETK